jgi:hypothetical protein
MNTNVYPLLAHLSIASSGLSLLCLVVLHFVSPEFRPSWRMISEYALGHHKWLITAFFFLWGIGSVLLSALVWNQITTGWAQLGVVLLLLSGVGAISGGLFDVKHPWHGLAFGLGVPSLPVAALLIGFNLVEIDSWSVQRRAILLSAHATWISVVLMAVAMVLMFAGFKRAGVPLGPDAAPPERVPDGVIAWGGYANRLLVVCYIGWSVVVANGFLSVGQP